ncbi:MAG: type I methionyl aminopeptidase [Chloroflexi bacterium]|nr:type I methionyl aminopeptidase [Chloroflexota bacterium]
MAIQTKTAPEIRLMREAGRIVARAHEAMREKIRPGMNTLEFDKIVMRVFEQHKAFPAFLGYPYGSKHPFPASVTVSINDELVHGIPSKDRILQEGDIVSLDTGCIYQGFVGDAAYSYGVGSITPEAQQLLDVTEAALMEAIRASVVGHDVSHVAKAIQHYAESNGYNVVRGYTGHGVGHKMHEDPQVPCWWPSPNRRQRMKSTKAALLKPGMTIAIEPMIIAGHPATRVLDDHWTVVIADGSLCAHFEHSIAITEGEPEILTLL